jgi:hypothetical protein
MRVNVAIDIYFYRIIFTSVLSHEGRLRRRLEVREGSGGRGRFRKSLAAAEAIAVRRLDQTPQGRRVWCSRIPNTERPVSGPPAADKKGLSQKEGLVTPPGLLWRKAYKHRARDVRTNRHSRKTTLVLLILRTRPWRTGKSSASRAALIFEGREWGKPQARFSGLRLTMIRREKTSRGNDDGCLFSASSRKPHRSRACPTSTF